MSDAEQLPLDLNSEDQRRRCRVCGEKGHYSTTCGMVDASVVAERARRRKESERARNVRAYRKHKQKRDAEVQRWKKANPDKVRAYHRGHWERNGDRVLALRAAKREAAYEADPRGMWILETFRAAQTRARKKGIPFDAKPPSIELPDVCPVLGVAIAYHAKNGKHAPNSPSLDRIIPERGYVAGNLRVISNRANTLKNNATVEEMRLVLADMERNL